MPVALSSLILQLISLTQIGGNCARNALKGQYYISPGQDRRRAAEAVAALGCSSANIVRAESIVYQPSFAEDETKPRTDFGLGYVPIGATSTTRPMEVFQQNPGRRRSSQTRFALPWADLVLPLQGSNCEFLAVNHPR